MLGAVTVGLQNPYRGLASFRPEDAQVFFGREDLTRKLLQRFQSLHTEPGQVRLLAVLGPSGSGKSSVALAGLLPRLRALPGPVAPRVVIFQPGERPVESLARALVPLLPLAPDRLPASRQVAVEALLRSPEVPGEGLRRFAADLIDIAVAPLVIAVDQFEEVYTLCKEPTERSTLVALLLHAASDASRHVSVVLTLRSDFLGETQRQHPALNRAIAAQNELVPAMSRAELCAAIVEPARFAGLPLDGAVVELLLAQVHGSDGALPLLEFALTQIWEGLTDGQEPAMTLAQIGGVGGALAKQAQTLFAGLGPQEQRTAQRAFVRLVQLGEGTRDTRRRVALPELCGRGETAAQVLAVMRPFTGNRARLVTLAAPSQNPTAVTAEVTHEALFQHWTELRQWIDESRADRRFHDRIAEAAKLWARDQRPPGRLWRPPDLDLLHEYAARRGEELGGTESEFYAASTQQQEAESAAKQESERKLRDAYEQLRQQLLSTYVERGRQLLTQGDAMRALLWLHRAYEQGHAEPALQYLLAQAMQPLDAAMQVLVGHGDGLSKPRR